MRQMHIALGLIKQGDNYLFQFRNGDPKIGAAGLIGCFGGKIDEGEDPIATFCREIYEETALQPTPQEVKSLGIVNVRSDHNLEPVQVTGHVFHWELKSTEFPEIKEGELVIYSQDEVLANINKLTPATRAVFEELM